MQIHQNYVAGRFVGTPGSTNIPVFNPARGSKIAEIPDTSNDLVREAVESAKKAQLTWGKLPAIQRARHLRAIADKIRDKVDVIGHAICEEQGKILSLAKIEAAFAADYIDYMSEWARRIEGEIINSDRPNENIFIFRQPIGVVAGILPWNFPFFLIARKLAPALITGNTIVIKPSEETPNNAALFAHIVAETDLPPGVFNMVYGRGESVGHTLASHPDVGMVSFTGSVETGSAIMRAAAPNLTKVNLELGGKAPAIVMADADIDLAVTAVKSSRIINNGQACNCAERVYVHRKVADEFVSKLAGAMKATTYGDPLSDQAVDMGPLINAAAVEKADQLVQKAVAEGAEVVVGGKPDSRGGGTYYQPTVVVKCTQEMEIMRKEIFAPVAPVHVVADLDEAIAKANDSVYGLTSSIYTTDINTAMRACNEINFGETYINRENFEAMQGFHAGMRRSGIGGADGKHGLLEHTQTHAVYVQHKI